MTIKSKMSDTAVVHFARSMTCVATVKSYTYRRLTQRLGQERWRTHAAATRPSFARNVITLPHLTAR